VAKHLVRRSIFRKRTLFICTAVFAGAVIPDLGHILNYITQGKVDWNITHFAHVLFFWVFISCFFGLVLIFVWQRLGLSKSDTKKDSRTPLTEHTIKIQPFNKQINGNG
jgi:hypothetical protein